MTFRRSHRTLLASAFLAIGMSARSAHADPSPEDKAQADAFFREGRSLMSAQNFAAACGKFAESERLDPAPGTLVNLALCHERDGKTASAWAEFNEVAERPGDDPARGPFARTHAADIEKRLSRVRVAVPKPAADLVVTIDGRPHSAAAWGSPMPLDPGEHIVEATAPGRKTWTEHVHLASGPVLLDVTVPPLEAEASAAIVASGPSVSPVSPDSTAPGHGGSVPPTRIAGYIVGGVGVAALVVGGVFGLKTLSKKSDADALCPNNKCAGDPRVSALDDDAKSAALVSTVAFGVGAAAIAAGIVLVVTAHPAEPAGATARFHLLPDLASHGGGASLVGRF